MHHRPIGVGVPGEQRAHRPGGDPFDRVGTGGQVGAGGGFLVVPALALLGGLPMPVAVGTSLVVIAMKSFAGLAGTSPA